MPHRFYRHTAFAIGSALLFALARSATAGSLLLDDHLACTRIRDTAPKATYSLDLVATPTPFPPNTGCVLKTPARLLCHAATKTNVKPLPPGAPDGQTLTEMFACYNVKCPKSAASLTVTDQFGSRTVSAQSTTILCVPANTPGPPCGQTAPTCNGSCPPGATCGMLINGTCACGVG